MKSILALCTLLSACAVTDYGQRDVALPTSKAVMTPATLSNQILGGLPKPRGAIIASVYQFRDLTGQYKESPNSSYSTLVTQGASNLLVKAMLDSHWFIPVERESLQNLLTERRIQRATQNASAMNKDPGMNGLLPAQILLEGGVVAYDKSVKTGGFGLRYLGIGASDLYETDQVTVSLRAVDIATGRILTSVTTTKTIYSYKLSGDVFRFVRYKSLLEADVGFTRNEPTQLCVQDAIEAAVAHLIVQGVNARLWEYADPESANDPYVLQLQQEQMQAVQVQTKS